VGKPKSTRRSFNFTKREIEDLPIPEKKRVIYHDTRIKGLGIMVQPGKGHRSFFWFRKINGRPTWKTIGTFPEIPVEKARSDASTNNTKFENWKSAEYEGENPLKSGVVPTTFDALVEDYIERHVLGHASRPEKAAANVRWMVRKYLAGWGNRKVSTITNDDVQTLHADIGKDAKHTANRIVQLVRALFNFAIKGRSRGLKRNPAVGIMLFHEAKRRRFLEPDELPRFFAALKKKETSTDLRDFVNLSLWTGARRNDILSMRWQDISLDDNRWLVPDPKNREPYEIALVPEAIAILRDRGRHSESAWVFPSRGKSGHIVDLKGAWKKLLVGARVTGLRIHDLRRTLGSWQAAMGASTLVIGKSLGHSSAQSTMVYARLDLASVRTSVNAATQAMIAASKKKPKRLPGRS
jgi:integrase